MRIHPHDSILRRALGRPTKASKKVLEHIEQCIKCRTRLAFLTTTKAWVRRSSESDYWPVLDRAYKALEVRQASLERERSEAPRLFTRLMDLIPERQRLLLRNSGRFQTWGLMELLVEHGEEETFVDPDHAEEIFRLALEVAEHLDSTFYGRERLEDLRARAWGQIGNIRRINADLEASEEIFEEAFRRLPSGTGDPLERGVLFDLQASLRRYQGRLEESVRLSSQAIAIFSRMGENHRAGKALVKLSLAHRRMGNGNQALLVLHRSFDLFDPVREPRLALGALHNLGDCLAEVGRFMDARRVIARARPLYRRFSDPRWQSRRKWLEAKIAWEFGHYQQAEALMVEARDGFLSVNASYDSELAARELASLRAGAESIS